MVFMVSLFGQENLFLPFKYWIYSLAVLGLKMYGGSILQGFFRVTRKAFTRPDDAKFFGRGTSPLNEDIPLVKRLNGCWSNDLENIPLFLFSSLAYIICGTLSPEISVKVAECAGFYFLTFVLARILHTLTYIFSLQPWRFLCYLVGAVVNLILLTKCVLFVCSLS